MFDKVVWMCAQRLLCGEQTVTGVMVCADQNPGATLDPGASVQPKPNPPSSLHNRLGPGCYPDLRVSQRSPSLSLTTHSPRPLLQHALALTL